MQRFKLVLNTMAAILALLAFFTTSDAQIQHTLKAGYPVCDSESALDKFVELSVQKDNVAGAKLLMSGACAVSKNGLTVYLEDVGLLCGKVKVRIEGETGAVWTLREAIF